MVPSTHHWGRVSSTSGFAKALKRPAALRRIAPLIRPAGGGRGIGESMQIVSMLTKFNAEFRFDKTIEEKRMMQILVM